MTYPRCDSEVTVEGFGSPLRCDMPRDHYGMHAFALAASVPDCWVRWYTPAPSPQKPSAK